MPNLRPSKAGVDRIMKIAAKIRIMEPHLSETEVVMKAGQKHVELTNAKIQKRINSKKKPKDPLDFDKKKKKKKKKNKNSSD